MDKAAGVTQLVRDLSYGPSLCAQSGNLGSVDVCPWPSDARALRFSVLQAGADTLADQLALEFGHRSDDIEHEPPAGRAQIQVVTEGNERDVQGFKLRECVHQMAHRSAKAVELPDHNRIESATVRVRHEPVQFRPRILCAAHTRIDVLAGDLPSSALTVFADLAGLYLRVLDVAAFRDSRIDGGSHLCCLPLRGLGPGF